MRPLLSGAALVAAALLAACANTHSASALNEAGPGPSQPGDVVRDPRVTLDPSKTVAIIDGKPVTGAELDKSIDDDLQKTTDEYVEKVHDLRKQGLEGLVDERLIEMEAKAQGTTKEALVKKEIQDKVAKPTDAEVQKFYDDKVKGKYEVSFDDAKDQIAQQLRQDKLATRVKAYLDELKAKYKVTTSLPELPIQRVNVAATGPSQGPANAKVTIVEFSDFQCPFCGRAFSTVKELMKKYNGKVRLVFRNYPLPFHEHAEKAAEAALCANEQGKFWQMHDQLFTHQDHLEVADIEGYAKGLGLDQKKFDECFSSGKMAAVVEKDKKAGEHARVNGTPAFFINGRSLSGAQPLDAFSEIIDAELAKK